MTHLPRQLCAALALSSVFLGLTASGAVLYVDLNSTNPVAPYTSWSTAATTIQDAVDAANPGDQLLVNDGRYQTGARSVDGTTTNRVVINKAVTVQSVNGSAATAIDGGGIMRCAYLTNGAALVGFTLTNGFTSGNGGGVLGQTNSSIVSGCVIIGCTAANGGGLYGATASNSIISSCGNSSSTYGGGAVNATLVNCLVKINSASTAGGAGASTLVGCEIVNNVAANNAGGLDNCTASFCSISTNTAQCGQAAGQGYGYGGGANNSTLTDCIIDGNRAQSSFNCCQAQGGGISTGTATACTISGNGASGTGGGAWAALLYNCIISLNTASTVGGGTWRCGVENSLLSGNFAAVDAGGDYLSTLISCTIVNNFSESGGTGGVDGSSMDNCILYFNTLLGNVPSNGANASYNYCCTTPMPSSGTGNITNNPLFLAQGFQLTAGSPCRGAGSSAYSVGVDIDGLPWLNPPSMGCAEYYTNAAPTVAIQAAYTNTLAGQPLNFQASVTGGQPAYLLWNFGDSSADGAGAATSHAWVMPGDYVVQVTAFFTNSPITATQSIAVHVATNNLPGIISQPSDQSVIQGGAVQFSVTASGSPVFTYQWQFNGTNIPGATNSSLQLTYVQTNQAGAYSVIVFNPLYNPPGQITSSNAFLTVNLPVCLPPPQGLVSWWRAEGDFTDAVDGNNGVGQNVSFAAGKVGQAFVFADGASSISVPASSTLNIGSGTGLSIECWIQPDAFALGGTGAPILEWDTGRTNFVRFWAGNTLLGSIVDGTGTPHTVQSPPGLLDTIHWQHVAFTYDVGSGAAVLYLNGNLAASNNLGSIAPQTSGTLNIGWSAATSNFFGGLMDEVSLYNRALSPTEVINVFNAEQAGKCNVPVAPTVVLQPQNFSLLPGSSGQLNVIAAGTAPLTYQWTLNGNPIDSATNASLMLSNVDCSQNGNIYAVAVTNSAGFVVSSNAVLSIINTPPQISGISNQVASYSTPFVTVPFVVSDTGLPPSSVAVSGVSSNTSLVPNGQIVFGGADSNRTVTVTANSNVFGATLISVTATGPCGASNQTSFSFVVTNFPPQISAIAAQEGPLNASLLIPFTVSDVETPASDLVVTARSSNNSTVPTNQMVLGGSGTNRTLTIMPGTNIAGTATVTLTVTDALGASNSTSFTVRLDQFTLNAVLGLPNLEFSAAAWGDYDNDGKLDLLITGTTNGGPSGAITRIYHNDGGVFTNFISLPGVYKSAVAWSDYDRDGFLDFAVSGQNISNVPVTWIYHNNGDGTFTNISAGLAGAYSGSLAWGDFNNDGAPDLFVCGILNTNTLIAPTTNISKLYRNNGDGTFTDMKANLPALSRGSAVWADFDNNGTPDLLLAGATNAQIGGLSVFIAGIYRNLGNGVFTVITNFPTRVQNANYAVVGDFNNDGWLDVVICDESTTIYSNKQNGTFAQTASLAGGEAPSAVAGDFGNDGYMDIVLGANPSRFYHNNQNGTFTDTSALLPLIANASVAAGDFNSDGKLDLAFAGLTNVNIWQNDNFTSDTLPIAPASLAAVNLQSNSVMLSWSPSMDAQTTSNGVSYNLRVGTTPGGVDVVPPLANPTTGQRRVAAMGNAGLTNAALLMDLPKGAYYWSVQAVDAAFEGSMFATEGSFEITNSRPSISTVPDQAVAPLSTLTIPFSIADADNTPAQLSFIVQSSNTNVVPLSNIVLRVPNPAFPSNYVAQITALTNGASTITITVSDPQGAFASTLFSLTAAQFTLLSANFIPLQRSFIACGDFDNDGNLDFLVGGVTNGNPNLPVTQLYRNVGGGVFTPVNAGLPNVDFGSAAWGDFDNSGNLGLVLTGTMNGAANGAIARIYRNNGGGSFTDIGAGLPGVVEGAVAWGDFDNDGRLDLLITGTTNGSTTGGIALLYRNMGNGVFSNAFAFPGVYLSAVAFADLDGDGFPDIVIAGQGTDGVDTTVVYRNNRGKSFTPMATLTGVANGSVSTGDFNNDGVPDILLSGITSSGTVTRVYQNNGGFSFTDIAPGIVQGIEFGSVAWGDVDNDGLADILITGTSSGTTFGGLTRVYHNTGSFLSGHSFTNFALYSSLLPTNSLGAAAWGDFENRGVLDVLVAGATGTQVSQTLLFRNNCPLSNTPPSAPTGLSFNRSNTTVLLAWNKSSDAQTTNSSLNYQVRIGTTPGGIDIKSPPADPVTGHRRVVQAGDAITNAWNINGLAPGTYYWSVQAIDTGFAGSPFSTESTFTVLPPPIAIPDAFFTPSNTPAIFPSANLTTNDIDLSGLPLTVIAVASNSASGGTVSLNSGTVTYTPPANFGGNDTFWYSVSDGQSPSAIGTVTATVGTGGMVWLHVVSGPLIDSNGNFVLRLAGVPGLTYTIEGAPSPAGPWTKITNLTAPQTDEGFGVGVFEFTQPAANMAQFYRIIYPSY